MTGARNLRGGLMMMSLGLAGGLGMSLYAFTPMVPVPASLARYDDLPRRLIRLAHIAAIMLPLINVVLAPWLDRLRLSSALRQTASWLLLLGAAGLPLTLALEALVPPLIAWHLSGAPAIGFSLGVVLVTAGAWRADLLEEDPHAALDRRGRQDRADRGRIFQASPR
jgi:hypothetical protein